MATLLNNIEYEIYPSSIEKIEQNNVSTKTILRTISSKKLSFAKTNIYSRYRKLPMLSFNISHNQDSPMSSEYLAKIEKAYQNQEKITFQFDEWNREYGSLYLLEKNDNKYYFATHLFPVIEMDSTYYINNIIINNFYLKDIIAIGSEFDVPQSNDILTYNFDGEYGILELKTNNKDLNFTNVYMNYKVSMSGYIKKLDYSNIVDFDNYYSGNYIFESLLHE
jgi:hypothetical protein